MKEVIYHNWKGIPGPLAEKELLYLMGTADGLTSKQIAREHNVSPRTVGAAMERVFFKLSDVLPIDRGAKRASAIAHAIARGWIVHLVLCLVFVSGFDGSEFIRTRPPRPNQPVSQSSLRRDY